MTAVIVSRSFNPLTSLALCAAVLCIGLGGCQSEQEQRIAAARESVLQQQKIEADASRPAVPALPPEPARPTPATARPASGPAKASDLGMPLYPGARQINTGPSDHSWIGDGLTMALLETKDSVDTVIAFYADKLNESHGPLPPSKTEDKLDGHRVVRISAPQEGGGLQTVEAREDNGKTTIQLMNMKGNGHAPVPSTIPGVPAFGSGGSVSTHDLTLPGGHTTR